MIEERAMGTYAYFHWPMTVNKMNQSGAYCWIIMLNHSYTYD
ncbi:hypothetical protein PAUR_a2724 [Pseudoalteromonas aurantia 208]|uniref:Uncharacterized protein n=1 Tax=Pseudoalteromonas aurantia 208 TaxID=1314867 RepID=A0ABR9EF04_9GAMM|nr:hypothetical protein [Pseudoalteromonas aurantia 208]